MVDDDPVILEFVSVLLDEGDYKVLTAISGEAALTQAGTSCPSHSLPHNCERWLRVWFVRTGVPGSQTPTHDHLST